MRLAGCTLALCLAVVWPAYADPDVGVRVGSHPGFGRVVFDLPPDTPYHVSRDGDRLVIHFDGVGNVTSGSSTARNVTHISGAAGQATLDLAAGARTRVARLGSRLVVDVLDDSTPAAPSADDPASPPTTAAKPPAPGARKATEATPLKPSKPKAAAKEEPKPSQAAAAVAPAMPDPADAAKPLVTANPLPAKADALSAAEPQSAPVPTSPKASPPDKPEGVAPAAHDVAPPTSPTPVPEVKTEAATPTASPQGPVALDAVAEPVTQPHAPSVLLPFARSTGVAAFEHGQTAYIVFDERRPIDLSSLGPDPAVPGLSVTVGEAATIVSVPLGPGQDVRLERQPAGWSLALGTGRPLPAPIVATAVDGTMHFAARRPGRVVTIPDPQTGDNLLVGTQLQGGEALPVRHRAPEFTILRSFAGVLIAPRSDRVTLRAVKDGFVLAAVGDPPLALPPPSDAAQALGEAGMLTRRFDFPNLPTDALVRRMQAETDGAALAPPLGRFQPRLDTAQTMVALGMGAEAQALVRLAQSDDPQHAADPSAIGLAAIGAVVDHRLDEAGGLDDPSLTGTDEIDLWRALRDTLRHGATPAEAAVFAADLPLLLAYPDALRDAFLPVAAEAMVEGGQVPVAEALLAKRPDDGSLALARAMLLRGKGDTDGALTLFDTLATGRDRDISSRAAVDAIELRLKSGKLTPQAAADAYDAQLVAWRGDDRERRVRERAAELHAQAGNWREALSLLRETATLFPDSSDTIRTRMSEMMVRMLDGTNGSEMKPLDVVAALDENADMLPQGDAGERVAPLLADKLVSLDLPTRADPVLAKLMSSAQPGLVKATFGARLASMRLEEGNARDALGALVASDPGDQLSSLPEPLIERRTVERARAQSMLGDADGALKTLGNLSGDDALDFRAKLCSDAHDWHGAEAALGTLFANALPTNGGPDGAPLDAHQQDLLLRFAGAASQAGDTEQLRRLADMIPRLPPGPKADTLRLLTQEPVHGTADIPRVADEVALAKALPSGVGGLGAH